MVYIVCVARTNVDNIPISDSFKNMRDGNNLIQYQHQVPIIVTVHSLLKNRNVVTS